MRETTGSLRTTLLTITVLILATLLVISNIHSPSRTVEAAPAPALQTDRTLTALGQTGGKPDQELLAALYDRSAPSVVNIQVTTRSAGNPQFGAPATPQGGEGTGWVWDSEGHIVTNNHVVEDASPSWSTLPTACGPTLNWWPATPRPTWR